MQRGKGKHSSAARSHECSVRSRTGTNEHVSALVPSLVPSLSRVRRTTLSSAMLVVAVAAATSSLTTRASAGAGECGDPTSGSCFAVQSTPSCADATCCNAVCALDPFCCEEVWDAVCRQNANDLPVCAVPVPSNDAPESARFSLPGLVAFTTVGATDSAVTEIPAACGGVFGDEIRRDVWFEFRADRTGFMRLNTCPAEGSGAFCEFDPILVLRDATTFASIACNDEGIGCGGYATLEFPTIAGERYLIQIGGHDFEIGNGAVRVTETGTPTAAPTNDACADATTVAVPTKGASVSFDLLGATPSTSPGTSLCGAGLADVWFLVGPFEANGVATLSACSNDAPVQIEAGSGSCGDELICSASDACVEGAGVEVKVAKGASLLVRVASLARAEGELSVAFQPISACPSDLDGDGAVSAADLSLVLLNWGTTAADIDGDGTTSASDLSLVLEAWGACG